MSRWTDSYRVGSEVEILTPRMVSQKWWRCFVVRFTAAGLPVVSDDTIIKVRSHIRPFTARDGSTMAEQVPLAVVPQVCSWFAACDYNAIDIEQHPILGGVPICARCRAHARAQS